MGRSKELLDLSRKIANLHEIENLSDVFLEIKCKLFWYVPLTVQICTEEMFYGWIKQQLGSLVLKAKRQRKLYFSFQQWSLTQYVAINVIGVLPWENCAWIFLWVLHFSRKTLVVVLFTPLFETFCGASSHSLFLVERRSIPIQHCCVFDAYWSIQKQRTFLLLGCYKLKAFLWSRFWVDQLFQTI